MQFVSTFEVPAPIDEAWELLGDIPKIAPCLPGATVRPLSDDTYDGDVAVKVGPIRAGYTGTATVSRRDEEAHVMVIDAQGREGSGKGTAAATITLLLSPSGDSSTTAEVTTDLTITGRLAQFGRSALADVSQRLMNEFAANLAQQALGQAPAAPPAVASGTPAAAAAVSPAPQQAASNELDAMTFVLPMLKRAAPAVGAAVLGLVLGALWGSARRGRHQQQSMMTPPPWAYGQGWGGGWPTPPTD